jgi:hypothetical protein
LALASSRAKATFEVRSIKTYPIGFFHIDIAELRTEEGKLYLFRARPKQSRSQGGVATQ